MAEAEDISWRAAALMDSGAAADSGAAMDLAEEHRGWISRNRYGCSYEIHTSLGISPACSLICWRRLNKPHP